MILYFQPQTTEHTQALSNRALSSLGLIDRTYFPEKRTKVKYHARYGTKHCLNER